MSYLKVDLDLIKEIGDIRQANLISLLINQDKSGDELNTLKWQQTKLSDILQVNTKTINRDLIKLQNDGWLNFKQSLYKNLTTTEITLTEKALKYKIVDKEQIENINATSTKINKRVNKQTQTPSKFNITDISNKQLTEKEKYLLYIKEKMSKEDNNIIKSE